MLINRILCPIDFSKYNQVANDYASALAQSTGASITYLHTYLPDPVYGDASLFDAEEHENRFRQKLEDEFQPTCDGVEATYAVVFGTPADRILRFAEENEIDMIVIGTHGRTGLKRLIMGSVAESIVRRATCPVLAIKTPAQVTQDV